MPLSTNTESSPKSTAPLMSVRIWSPTITTRDAVGAAATRLHGRLEHRGERLAQLVEA